MKVREDFGEPTDFVSEEMKNLVDKEVKRIIKEAYERTKELISQNMDKLENLAKALLERETLTGEEIDMAMKGELKTDNKDSNDSSPPKEGLKGSLPKPFTPQWEA